MLLLNGSTTPLPQFASLSLVLNSDEHDERSVQMVSPLLTCAPLAFISHNQALQSLHELQFHLHSTIKAATEVSTEPEDQIAMGFFKEDARQMEDVQLFTPLAPAGLGVYYRLIRTDKKPVVQKIAQLILSAHKGSASSSSATPVDGVWGFVISVGIAGLPLVTMPSQAFYHVSERVNDIKEILTRRGDLDVNNVQTLLSTMLLLENDARMTNARMEQVRNVIVPEPEDTTGERKGGLISPLGVRRRGGKSANDDQQQREDAVLSLSTPPAEATRIVTEKLKVLSVAESQTLLQKYKRAAIERKASLDLTGGSSKGRFRRNRSMTSRDPDFDNFDYKGPSRGGPSAAEGIAPLGSSASVQSSFQGSVSSHSKSTISSSRQSLALRQPSKDTKLKAGMLSAPKNDAGHNRRRSNVTNSSQTFDEEASAATGAGFDPFSPSSAGGEEASVPGGQSRLQVNVALNEDLSCSYRQSQMSSCTVEGVVQVQVRASSQTAPFYLLLRDPTEQVDSFQENRKFADDVSSAILAEDDADRKYTISVPNGDNYFPVVRYKCVEDLRPVPIRVQTRAKTEGTSCRVALQISSNPNNEAKLTDLTIIMGVPDDVEGESLVTQPAGGVWNDARRCVTWCVEELAEGEKFQLQARFQMAQGAPYDKTGENPLFPVLVRCQCLFAQLSDLELEIREIPEIYPADVTMKIARRFRLSHRERA